MKVNIKKYLLGFSILACLVMDGLLAKPIISWFSPANKDTISTSIDSPTTFFVSDNLYVARDLTLYTQEATAIIIGEVKDVSDPYLPKDDSIISHQDVQIDVKEILKGDAHMTDLTLLIEGGHMVRKSKKGDISFSLPEDEFRFQPGEKILLFVGKTMNNNYTPLAGPYSKYLIDENNTVTGIGEFKMPLEDLKGIIYEALQLPPKEY